MTDKVSSSGPGDVTVAISTLGDRLDQLQLPEPVAGLSYLILVQRPEPDMRQFERPDVRLVPLEGTGLSRSRNAALQLCEAPFLLVSDDDVLLAPAAILALRDVLSNSPELGFAAGWRADRLPSSGRRAVPHRLRWWNSGRLCAPEFLLRCADLRRAGVRFDESFGLGARYPLGEEYVFVTDLFKAGLKGVSVPLAIARHPGESSGADWHSADLLQARLQMLRRVFGGWSPLVRLLYAWRHRRQLGAHLWPFLCGCVKTRRIEDGE